MPLQDFQVFKSDLSEVALSEYLAVEEIGIDTEAMGLIPHRDRLCLVQLCDSRGRVSVVQIVKGQGEAKNLKLLLENNDVLKVFHYARFDMATLQYHLNIRVNPFFCTKISSKLARTYTSKHGLKDLVESLEMVQLDKSAQSSDWGNVENLSEEQLRYAANDVRYLLSLRAKLTEVLKREERWELAQKCFQCLPTIIELDLLSYKDIFEH
ncbi:ribonuclease H-like domain-containing protein [Pantanalinema rosaneae CENA516]|uniref:ribonuclease H-like domain-containing protein n=1 Tax=Pantanalinema rosaneae TaxID=1620701 RepID=UPI003D6EE615